MKSSGSSIDVQERGPQKFGLIVVFEDQSFDCGVYVSRAEALKAGRLFVERKEGERNGRQKRPRKK